MQTLLAYAFERSVPEARVAAGLARVESWYARLWGEPPQRNAAHAGRLGMCHWDAPGQECRWPSWTETGDPDGTGTGGEATATLAVPLGYDKVLGGVRLAEAPGALARRLLDRPEQVMALTPPFVVAQLDRARGSLALVTDGLGLGRLFELRTDEGRVWSNRPVAAVRFAGVRAEADPLAWRQVAASDWVMGDRTPYRGVRVVPAATQIIVGRRGPREQTLDALRLLSDARREPLTAPSLDATGAALTAVAGATSQLWSGAPVLSLSGGRDSRLVAAVFLAAGAEVSLRTYSAAAGEAETARRLVAALDRPVEHEVAVPAAQRAVRRRGGALARARRWHDATEGLRPAVYLRNIAPKSLPRQRRLLVSGVGGEFGHAPGYPDDVVRLEGLPERARLDAFARTLTAKVVAPRGLAPASVAAVEEHTRAVIAHAQARGVTDAKVLDWYYADERLRRWGMHGEASGKVMPLLSPEFVRACFGLTTAQSTASALHAALIARLVPAWAEVPFYTATLRQRQAVAQQRLWEEDDVDVLDGVMADLSGWGEAFDAASVRTIWRQARAGRAAGRDELLLQRVVWRAGFEDHLAAVNAEPVPDRPALRVDLPVAPKRDWTRPVRELAMAANEISLARRLARTRLGRELRRRLGV